MYETYIQINVPTFNTCSLWIAESFIAPQRDLGCVRCPREKVGSRTVVARIRALLVQWPRRIAANLQLRLSAGSAAYQVSSQSRHEEEEHGQCPRARVLAPVPDREHGRYGRRERHKETVALVRRLMISGSWHESQFSECCSGSVHALFLTSPVVRHLT